MARRDHGAAAEMLGELESAADRLGEWLQTNLRPVAAAIAALLVVAGIGAWIVSARNSAEQEASNALAQTRTDFLSAMGAAPGAIDVPELANREAASQIRAEYEQRYAVVAATHPGTVAGALAALEQARLANEGGRGDEAIGLLEQALSDAPSDGPVRGMMLQQLAQRLEAAGRWTDAAGRHEAAAQLADYPLRQWALADAARCRALARENTAALALYERLEREAPELPLSDVQKAQRLELRAAAE